jgi:ribonuclease E
MVLTQPTHSVLRRHATTERNRVLGLPPSDSVLRRHYEQLLSVAAQPQAPTAALPQAFAAPTRATAASAQMPAARPVQAAAAAPATAPVTAPAQAPAPAAAAAAGGGLFGWLRRLLGAA